MTQENSIEELTKLLDKHLIEVLPGGVWQTCTNPKHLVQEIVKNLNLFVVSKTVCPNCYDNKVINHKQSDKSTCVDCGFQWQTGY